VFDEAQREIDAEIPPNGWDRDRTIFFSFSVTEGESP
jgi:hypothetical protein